MRQTGRFHGAEPLYRQDEMAPVILEQSVLFHLSELQRQSAALDAEIIRKLLPGKRNVEFVGSEPLRFCGKVGHDLCARGTLSHMREFFAQPQTFSGKLAEEVPDDSAVVRAGGRAHVQNARYIQKQRRDRCFRYDAHIQSGTGGAGIHKNHSI